MEAMAEFFESPTEGYLEGLTKNQLGEVAEHYKFNETLPKDLRKQELKEGVRKGLVERSIIGASSYPLNPTAASTPTRSVRFPCAEKLPQFHLLLKTEVISPRRGT